MPNYVYFLLAVAGLIVGYIIYGSIVAKIFGADENRPTPAKTMADGVDYVEMPMWKVWLIQLLNIAGVGPVFGPILGALYGPSALLWIVIGTIFAGAVHDYFSGMLSVRYKGANVPTIVGYNLGNVAKQVMRVFAVILLLLVGVVFVAAPAGLLAKLPPDYMDQMFWVAVIFAYYFLATILPIDKIIGRLYPLFGAVLIIMAVGMTVTMFTNGCEFYNWASFPNNHPQQLPIFPLVFITIACGALSGFHATQSPLMSRCLSNEKQGKAVFYGGMVAEGFIGLVWATVGMTFYTSPEALAAAGGPANVVNETARALMGPVGGVLAILGVVALPVTSDHRRNVQLQAVRHPGPSGHRHPDLRHRRGAELRGLQRDLALLRLRQPGPGRHHALGLRRLPVPQASSALDLHRARHLHDGRVYLLHLL